MRSIQDPHTEVRHILRAGSADVKLLRRFATDVYDKAFHDKHREDPDAWIGRLVEPGGDPEQRAIIAVREGDPVAGALTETYGGRVVLLTYIVVREDMRGRRLGSLMMSHVRTAHEGCGIFAEIADPEHEVADEGREHATRRASVFRAWGWREVRCAYHQPPLGAGGAWASDLILVHHGPQARIPAEAVDRLEQGLRQDLGAGPQPEGLQHRNPARHALQRWVATSEL